MRRRVEAGLDAVVREHRFTIAVVFPLAGAVLLTASARGHLPSPLSFNALLILAGTLVMRLPLIAALSPLVDRRAGALLVALTAYAYGIELVGLATGWPYGEFTYLIDLGPMIAGVPIGLPVFFLPLVVNAYLLSVLLLGDAARRSTVRLPAALAVVIAVDLVLDPAAVAIGFWAYADGGAYYGVPPSNYGGWLLSGAVAVVAIDAGFDRNAVRRRLEDCEFSLDDLVSFVLLWGAINALYASWLPVAIAAGIAVGIVRTDRFDFAVLGRYAGAVRR